MKYVPYVFIVTKSTQPLNETGRLICVHVLSTKKWRITLN